MTTEKSPINSLRVAFFTLSFAYLVYTPRIPELKDRLHISVSTLGEILLIVGLLGIGTFKIVRVIIERFSSRKSILLALPFTMSGSVIVGVVHSIPLFVVGLILISFGGFMINTAVNTQSNNFRETTGSNQLSNLSAISNLGSLCALLIGAILLKALTTTQYIIGIQVIVSTVFLFTYRNLIEHDVVHGKEKTKVPWFTNQQRQFWIITFALFCSTTAEFSVSDWGAILSRDDYKIKAPLYLAPFIFFQGGVILSRFAVNKMSKKMGEGRYVQLSALIASLVWGVSIQVAQRMPHNHQYVTLLVVLSGFFVAGCGVGPVWPTMLTSAAKSPFPVTTIFSRLFGFLSLAFVFGPGVIGYLSKHISLSNALMIPIVSLFIVGMIANRALIHKP